ncbi:unnamed protein product [Rhizophagus irregularis]|nr:unnamed protein product [Rhizophagus irregularis]
MKQAMEKFNSNTSRSMKLRKWTSILNGGQRVDKTEQAIKDNKPLFGNIRDKHNLTVKPIEDIVENMKSMNHIDKEETPSVEKTDITDKERDILEEYYFGSQELKDLFDE